MAITDRIRDQSLGALSSIGAGGMPGPGGGALTAAQNFEQTLLGGDRTAIMRQQAPGINLLLGQAAGARTNAARSPLRTGGTTAAQAQEMDKINQQIGGSILGAQAGAAPMLAQIGEQEFQTMMNALSTSAQIAQQDITQRNQAKAQLLGSLIGGAGKLVGGLAAGGFL